ncbi:MAG: sarcosine oxidase subunit beta [Candidatus Azotimanducaceae bacterium]
MSNQADVIILGAGIVGCSIAFSLAKRGIKTLNLDALPASGYGSTSHSSAVIRPIYSHVTSCAIAHESRFIWKNWKDFIGVEDDRGYANYTECGGMVLVKEGEIDQYQANLDAMQEVGVQYEIINEQEIKTLYPDILLDSFGPPKPLNDDDFATKTEGRITSAIMVGAAGYVSDPQLACHNLQVAAEHLGAKFLFNQEVVEIQQQNGIVTGVVTKKGDLFSAKTIVNAAGPHSSEVNKLAGIKLNIGTRAEKHEVVYQSAESSCFSNIEKFIVDFDAGVYFRPDGKDVLIGSADPECDIPDVVNPNDFNENFTEQWTLQSYRAAQRFPDVGISNTARGTVGLYDVSGDWIPIYDKSELSGFFLAIGTSGNQFKNAPMIGEIMAQIIEAEQDGKGHDETPAQLNLPNIGRDVSLDFYSRNREKQSTNSVMA